MTGKGSWHGRWRKLRVIGDKKGGATSQRLHSNLKLLDDFCALVGLPVHIVHVIRNPWDNIATIASRAAEVSGLPMHKCLPKAVDKFLDRCDAVRQLREQRPQMPVLDLYHDEFVMDPRNGLEQLCDFLNVARDDDWIECCTKVVRPSPNQSRFKVRWPDSLIDRVSGQIELYSWLRPQDREFARPAEE